MHAMSVAIIMGSSSDASIMDDAVQTLRSFGVPVEVRVLSAHRTPDDTIAFARGAADAGIEIIIAAAGGAAHLAGVVAAATSLPVIGVPIALANLDGLDSLLAMVQMPKGVPVATVAVNGPAMLRSWPSASWPSRTIASPTSSPDSAASSPTRSGTWTWRSWPATGPTDGDSDQPGGQGGARPGTASSSEHPASTRAMNGMSTPLWT